MARKERPRTTVVLDGSNVVSGGAGGGEVNGHLLISAVNLYQSHGYEVLPRMKRGTYDWMKITEQKGYNALRRITQKDSNPKLTFFGKNDDLYIINLALERNAWIVTQDTFEDKLFDGEEAKRERSHYPELPWPEIDDRTWGTEPRDGRVRPNDDWHTDGPDFLHPTLKQAPGLALKDEDTELRNHLEDLEEILDELDQSAENHPKPELEHVCEIRRHVGYLHLRFRKMLELVPKPTPPSEEKLRLMTVDVLKDYCRTLGFKVSGRKEELIKRIAESYDEQELTPEVDYEALEVDEEEATDIIGFTKEEFMEALLKCKRREVRENFAGLYGRLINKDNRFNLKKYRIKPGWYLEECSELIDFEIRVNVGESGNLKSYWI